MAAIQQMWEAKVMASKALEDIRHNNITSSKFVLQLPAHYNHSDEDRRPRGRHGDTVTYPTY